MKSAALRSGIEHQRRDGRLQEVTMSTPGVSLSGASIRRRDSLDDYPSEPMKHLMFAVLADAVQCFQRLRTNLGAQQGARAQEFTDVKWWLFEDESDAPFSFGNVCYILKFDPAAFRRALAESDLRRLPGRVRPAVLGLRIRRGRPTR
jgi:hypothetical protein